MNSGNENSRLAFTKLPCVVFGLVLFVFVYGFCLLFFPFVLCYVHLLLW